MSKSPRRSLFSAFMRRDEPSPRPSEVEEGTTAGHYVIAEELGAGGMGVVYRAHDTRLDRHVALKFLPPHLLEDEDASRRLLVEARAAAGLDHPNICTIHEIGTLEDGRSFIAMAYYPGTNLTRLIASRGRLEPADAVEIAAQVGQGLARAHSAEIIHRDIKPANIFVVEEGPVKILDFGIAKVAGVELTEDGAALGTIAYMSPEQIRGEALDGRTDIWSLGVVLYEMCTGERPFIGADHVAMMHGILELGVPPLDIMIPGFPSGLKAVIDRCLEKDRGDRFATVPEVIASLGTCLDGDGDAPAPARAPSLAEEGERKQATVVSAQLAGRGALEESMSPADVDRVLESCRTAMTEIVVDHGGVVNRSSGDSCEALFGIPASREDDALRAVRAAMTICERMGELLAGEGEGLGVRCGVDSGRVVARLDDGGTAEYRVVGDATELSARLAGQARAGEVVISESCRRLIGPLFDAADAGTLRRDNDETTGTFRILGETGARSRLEAAAETEGLTALAGRNSELNTLRQALRSAEAGQGKFVSIVGDAGAGKSRLLYEFYKGIDRSRFDVIRGRCQSFGEDVPYLPFIDALRDRLMLMDDAEPATPEVIADRVRRVSGDLDDFTPFYLQLLSVAEIEEDDEVSKLAGQEVWAGEQHRVGLVESLSAMFTLGAGERPTIALLEDWHWVDTASRQVLEQLLEMVSAYPLLIVVTARPDGDLGWGNPADHTPIVLGPLSPDDSEVVIASAMKAEEVPHALTRLLHDRAGGNPFFLEEVCRALSEEGTLKVERGRVIVAGPLDNLELPDTVQGVLRTRLDRLDGATRRLVRTASVIGREFRMDVLRHALGDDQDLAEDLDRLRDLGLIQQIRVVPTPTYRFKHALTQDVAYDGLLERQRAEIHGAVGEALETLRPDRLDDHLDRLAEHFASAGRWEKAVQYAVAATDRLWAFSEFGDAADLQARALEWAAHLPDDDRFERRVDLLLRQERLLEYLGQRDGQQEIVDELLEVLDPVEHWEKVATVYVRQGDLCILTRDHAGAEAALERALKITLDAGDRDLQRHALRSTGLLRWHQGRHEEAIALVEQALELDREIGNAEAVVGNLSNLGALYRAVGDLDRALDYLHQALEVERGIERRMAGLVVKESYILHLLGVTHASRGDRAEAYRYLEEARDTVATRSSVFNVVQMHYHLTAIARLKIDDGRLDEALELYEEAVSLCRRTRHLEGLTTTLRVRGEVLLNLERHEEALPDLEEAADLYSRMHDLPSEARMRRGTAIAQVALGNPGSSFDAWERALELSRGIGDSSLEIEALEGIGALLRRTDPARSLRSYESALSLVEGTEDRGRIGSLRYTIGVLRWEFGAYEDALRSFEAAFEDLTEAGDSLHAGLVLNSIGRTLRDLGRFDEATTRLEEAIALNEGTGERLLVAHALSTLGDVALDSDDPERAIERFTRALALRKELGDTTGQGWVLCSLVGAQLARGASGAAGAGYYLDEAADIAAGAADAELLRRCEALRAEVARAESEA